jgi:hypothetical protein
MRDRFEIGLESGERREFQKPAAQTAPHLWAQWRVEEETP